jgi:hypothetical protein
MWSASRGRDVCRNLDFKTHNNVCGTNMPPQTCYYCYDNTLELCKDCNIVYVCDNCAKNGLHNETCGIYPKSLDQANKVVSAVADKVVCTSFRDVTSFTGSDIMNGARIRLEPGMTYYIFNIYFDDEINVISTDYTYYNSYAEFCVDYKHIKVIAPFITQNGNRRWGQTGNVIPIILHVFGTTRYCYSMC